MPGLVPGIRVFKMLDGGDKPGWRRFAQVATPGILRLSGTRSGRLRTVLGRRMGTRFSDRVNEKYVALRA